MEVSLTEKDRAKALVQAARSLKAEEIVLLNVNGHSSFTDYVLICQGRSQGHVKGIADRIKEELSKYRIKPLSIEGYTEGSWILMDYEDVIVHIFHPATRIYYNLEELHKNALVETI